MNKDDAPLIAEPEVVTVKLPPTIVWRRLRLEGGNCPVCEAEMVITQVTPGVAYCPECASSFIAIENPLTAGIRIPGDVAGPLGGQIRGRR